MATHTRQSSSNTKRPLPAHARPTKPAPLSKRSNSYGASRKAVPLHKKEEDVEDEDLMATSFLQFCTTCEKQIIVPCNSVLYCSESCRKKDTEKHFIFPPDQSPPLTPYSQFSTFSFEDLHFRDIVPPRSPTQLRSNRSSCAFSDLSSDDNATSGDEKPRQHSDASRYLRHCQLTTYSDATVRPRRPHYVRASTSHVNFSAAPSLSHTPASSVSYSLPYTPSTRPLPPRTNPSSSYTYKSIDLVTPLTHASTAPSSPRQYSLKSHAETATSASTIEGEIMYAKTPIMSMSPANGSLGRLLASTTH
ncbi:uncharacterized protein N0V89_003877 [Didymosphaeria variabile]|uniref:Uncharacterized protein n=1 Tax=Didymosphaeria variabile TaxID=1932322 RepID=A0A9W9CD39_9PLEO|nr:uncharacterized protein N0V89_003877 [Didymosphaeria variabile]KAJ4355856.1 hypothetical protein N0V89_003877 [Didymosphaeria variabile]